MALGDTSAVRPPLHDRNRHRLDRSTTRDRRPDGVSRPRERAPRADSLLETAPEPWDYQDRYVIGTRPGQYQSVDQVAADWFHKQPTWLRLLSTNTTKRPHDDLGVADGGFRVGSTVGSWKVVTRSEREIVFGDSLGFMEFWYSFSLAPDEAGTVEGATAVRYLWPRTGRFYFALVRPVHGKFVELLLRTTVA